MVSELQPLCHSKPGRVKQDSQSVREDVGTVSEMQASYTGQIFEFDEVWYSA